ncbi:MAG: sugar transferase [Acidobacteria bacterium]|nr:sugar transferase [Acidobacteriota bacterium]
MKRTLDLVLAVIALAILSPFLLVLIVLSRVLLGRPVFYRQARPGLDGKPFSIYKFRTMTDARGPDGGLLPDRERLTRFGRFLRSTSLDEVPELWNILKGEMSWVGPRPLLVKYLPRYSAEQARRHEVKPGLTGWAQVNGRNAIGWEERLCLDVWYVDHRSLALDAKILARTLWKALRRDGIHQEGYATMPEFLGSEPPQKARSG